MYSTWWVAFAVMVPVMILGLLLVLDRLEETLFDDGEGLRPAPAPVPVRVPVTVRTDAPSRAA